MIHHRYRAGAAYLCDVLFVDDPIFYFRICPLQLHIYELVEIGAAVGLFLGVLFGVLLLRKMMVRNTHIEDQLRLASGAFMEVLDEYFTAWGLTLAERDVALFAIKGMSTSEMADLRDVSEGTIKAQTNAIYCKANVLSRTQLLSLFIDELICCADDAPAQ